MNLLTLIALLILADFFVDHFTGKSIIVRLLGRRVSNPRKVSAFAYLVVAAVLLVTGVWLQYSQG